MINTPQNCKIIAVSKTKSADKVREVFNRGYQNFGENYLQEALEKQKELKDLDIVWHFIGPIQSNKTKEIANNFSWVHSVDRLKIAKRLNSQSTKKLKILLQVNPQNESTKSGAMLDDLDDLINEVKKLENLDLQGFMCIPSKENPESAFKIIQELKHQYNLPHLSMGMSADYELAIKYGATMIRLGTKIFGARI